jgi:hypothetical protein
LETVGKYCNSWVLALLLVAYKKNYYSGVFGLLNTPEKYFG